MKIVVGVADNRWAAFLRDRGDITEANFWQPSPHGFKALQPGEPFLFKTKDPKKFKGVDIPGYHLVGGGFFDEYVQLRVSEAWMIWGVANGVATEAELLARAAAYRARTTTSVDPDPTIGCVVLRNIFFAQPGEELPEPPHWARNNVTYTGYDSAGPDPRVDTEYVEHAFTVLQQRARVDFAWEPDLHGVDLDWEGPRFGPRFLSGRVWGRAASSGQSRRRIGTDALSHRAQRSPASKPLTYDPSRTTVRMPSPTGCYCAPTYIACMTVDTSASMPTFACGSHPNCETTAGTVPSSTSARRLAT